MDLGLSGKKAILVGANGGIGRKVAHAFAAEGCAVAICGRSQDKVDKVVEELKPSGVSVYAEAVDVTEPSAVPAFVAAAAEALGGCDIFISFTSVNPGTDTDESWELILNTDILPMRRGIEAAMPFLEASDCGSILCMSSTGAVEDFMGVQPYNALKAAVINYSNALSQSLAPKGIRVNCITPGPVFCEDGPWAHIKENMTDFYDSILSQITLGRMTTGEEMAKSIVFMASPASAATVGANLVVDGGLTKRTQF